MSDKIWLTGLGMGTSKKICIATNILVLTLSFIQVDDADVPSIVGVSPDQQKIPVDIS